MVFYTERNNGVVALIREDDAAKYGLIKHAHGNPFAGGCRVFTFCGEDRDPEERRHFSGTHRDLNFLTKGHVVKNCGEQPDKDGEFHWDGFVPFSNHDFCDLRYETTLGDVIDRFGLRSTAD